MMPSPEPTLDAALSTRDRIVRAGLHLFQLRGYHGAGLNEILALAGAPKGVFYHHFVGGKEALAVATVEWLAAEVSAYLDGLLAKGGGAGVMVMGLAGRTSRGARRPDRLRGSLLAVLAQDTLPESAPVQAALEAWVNAMRERLATARHAEGVEPEAAAEFADEALAILQGATVLARIHGDPARLEHTVRRWLARQGSEVA